MKRPLETSDRRKTERLDAEAKTLEAQVQQRLRDMDRFHTERLCERYRHLVPAERIQRIKDLPTVFENRKEFERSYDLADGHRPPESRQVAGFSKGTDEAAHVDMDDTQLEKTAIHERVHQLSDPRANELLGRNVNEGVTEDLAIKELGRQPNPDLPRSYLRERATAQELRKMCGDNAIDRAYFQGDAGELRACLDRRLGKESLDKLERAADTSLSPERDSEEAGG
jgi:hypothetical protein